jgi:hypothetical protein
MLLSQSTTIHTTQWLVTEHTSITITLETRQWGALAEQEMLCFRVRQGTLRKPDTSPMED